MQSVVIVLYPAQILIIVFRDYSLVGDVLLYGLEGTQYYFSSELGELLSIYNHYNCMNMIAAVAGVGTWIIGPRGG